MLDAAAAKVVTLYGLDGVVMLGVFAVGVAEQSLSFGVVELLDAAIVVSLSLCFVCALLASLTAVVTPLTALSSTVRGVPLLFVLLSVLVIMFLLLNIVR